MTTDSTDTNLALTGPDLTPIQFHRTPARLGIPVWKFEEGRRLGFIPGPDAAGRWSAGLIDTVAARLDEILAGIGNTPPIGANKAADRVGAALDLDVERAEIIELVDRGLLVAVGEHKGWPTYDPRELDLAAAQHADLIANLVGERLAWLDASVTQWTAQQRLNWNREEFERVVADRGLVPGRFNRWPLTIIDELAADVELSDQVRGDRLVGPNEAADILEIRRTDWDYVTAAGWVTPADWTTSEISRHRTVRIPLYRHADVHAVLDVPGVDWEQVRSVESGGPSPLRLFAALPISRAALVRGFAADAGEQHGVQIDARYDHQRDSWELSWISGTDSAPTVAVVKAALIADPDLRPHVDAIALRVIDEGDRDDTPIDSPGM